MADDDEPPRFLVDAFASRQPSTDAVDLVKAAFTWRTVDAELAQVLFDSALDPAGVRAVGAQRTIELSCGAVTVLVEFDGDRATGRVEPPRAGTVVARQLEGATEAQIEADGAFQLTGLRSGTSRLEVGLGEELYVTDAFTI